MGRKMLIYALRDPRNGAYRYLGLSTRGMKRPREHLRAPRADDHTYRANWLRNLAAHGLRPEIVVVEYCETEDALSEAEADWIAVFRAMGCSLTNHLDGGFNGRQDAATIEKRIAPLRGRKLSDAHREALSESKRGELNPMFGRPVSQETREKRATSMRGARNHRYGMTPPNGEATRFVKGHRRNEGRPGLSGADHPMFGKHHSDGSRRKMGDSKRGRPGVRTGAKLTDEQRARLSAARTGTKMRCSVCGELGHNRQTCASRAVGA